MQKQGFDTTIPRVLPSTRGFVERDGAQMGLVGCPRRRRHRFHRMPKVKVRLLGLQIKGILVKM